MYLYMYICALGLVNENFDIYRKWGNYRLPPPSHDDWGCIVLQS